MNSLQKSALNLNYYKGYKVIALVSKRNTMNSKLYDESEIVVHKPLLVLEKDNEIIALSFYANETSKGNLQFSFIKVKPERILDLENEFIIDDTLSSVKYKSQQFYDELIFETINTSFSISINNRVSKQDLVFRYIMRYR